MNEVTRILSAIEHGDSEVASELLPLVYAELRLLAKQRLAQEKPGQTLQATALVHEAYLRLVDGGEARRWNSRGHFFAAAAEAMRRILVENARRKARLKHGGALARISVEALDVVSTEGGHELLELDEALTRLAAADPQACELVKLRYFAGLTVKQAAEALGISPRSADFLWAYAKAWLYKEVRGEPRPSGSPDRG